MQVLVTGAAGFLGYHLCRALLARGCEVVGVDNLSPYYDPALKQARLAELGGAGFTFIPGDISQKGFLLSLSGRMAAVEQVVHLAAQPGVRHALSAPQDYVTHNIAVHLEVLEFCRNQPGLRHLVYASSSAVYGANTKLPFSVADRADHPLSLYGASKRSAELMTESYSRLFGIRATGLRLFTVYGPFGRPDMAYYHFARALYSGEEITLHGNGEITRDFTYIDDAVSGIVAALDCPPDSGNDVPHRLFNIAGGKPEKLTTLLSLLEAASGRKARIRHAPPPADDLPATHADIAPSHEALGFNPQTTLDEGILRFDAWFRHYHGIS